MTEAVFRSDMSVELVDSMADDYMVCRAARISTGGNIPLSVLTGSDRGLIGYLMKNRHGTPFEHNAFTFRVECPIFTAREFVRHRMASYNEESGRFKELEGVFWVPGPARPLVQEGKPGRYDMRPGTPEQYNLALISIKDACHTAYENYVSMLNGGICREVARAALPVSIYTSFYVTMNARGLMNFLSLRIDDPDNTFTTKPQYEIQQAALDIQDHFSRHMPVTFRAFEENGRVAP